jgi:hypothetical protein
MVMIPGDFVVLVVRAELAGGVLSEKIEREAA